MHTPSCTRYPGSLPGTCTPTYIVLSCNLSVESIHVRPLPLPLLLSGIIIKSIMKASLVSLLLLASGVNGFVAPQSSNSLLLKMSASATEAEPFAKLDRVIMDDLPILYVYDHCPFCVRVRLALGAKNIKHLVHFLANDDIKTPTNLIGKKIAPIFVSNIYTYTYMYTYMYMTYSRPTHTHTHIYQSINRVSQLTTSSWANPWILSS